MTAADHTRTDWAAALAAMTLDEKAAMTAGVDFWNLAGVERLGIPSIRVTDGPNGARGSALFGLGTDTAVCIPCGSALGATWDPDLVERVGVMLGEEAHTKASRVLLAPTVNLHRSPLAGRNFECYSEDPLLSGKTAAAFVRGVQSQGVVTTVKHFAGNDAEFERQTINSVIDARALRELYLVPFELAVREGGALGVMTAYNRLNGPHCSEHAELITGILRGEWGFEGFVLTDWLSAGSTVGCSAAGLDLEMPGPGSYYGAKLADAVRAGEVDETTVDAQVTHLLRVLARIGALDDPPGRTSTSIDRPEHRTLAREAAAAAMVLLKNDGVLPFDASAVRTLAVIGPNALRPQMMGGGSANLAPHYRISPLDALRVKLGDAVDVQYARGVDFDRTAPPIDIELEAEFFAGTRACRRADRVPDLPRRQAAPGGRTATRCRHRRFLLPRHGRVHRRRDRVAHPHADADRWERPGDGGRCGGARRDRRSTRPRCGVPRLGERGGRGADRPGRRRPDARRRGVRRARRVLHARHEARAAPTVAAGSARARGRDRRRRRRGRRRGGHQRRLRDRGSATATPWTSRVGRTSSSVASWPRTRTRSWS